MLLLKEIQSDQNFLLLPNTLLVKIINLLLRVDLILKALCVSQLKPTLRNEEAGQDISNSNFFIFQKYRR